MRKNYLTLALVVAASLSLGACATNPSTGKPTIDPTQITDIENQVQKGAAAVCGFVPTLGTVASIIATFTGTSPIVGIVNQVVTSICNAVVPAKASLRRGAHRFGATNAPTVNGVPIQGYFIR